MGKYHPFMTDAAALEVFQLALRIEAIVLEEFERAKYSFMRDAREDPILPQINQTKGGLYLGGHGSRHNVTWSPWGERRFGEEGFVLGSDYQDVVYPGIHRRLELKAEYHFWQIPTPVDGIGTYMYTVKAVEGAVAPTGERLRLDKYMSQEAALTYWKRLMMTVKKPN